MTCLQNRCERNFATIPAGASIVVTIFSDDDTKLVVFGDSKDTEPSGQHKVHVMALRENRVRCVQCVRTIADL